MAVSMFIKTGDGDGDNGDLRDDNFIVCEPTDGVDV